MCSIDTCQRCCKVAVLSSFFDAVIVFLSFPQRVLWLGSAATLGYVANANYWTCPDSHPFVQVDDSGEMPYHRTRIDTRSSKIVATKNHSLHGR